MSATTTHPRPGRPPRPAALKRSEWLKVRVSTLEKEAAEARAEAAGLDLSNYVRLQVCGSAPEQTARRRKEAKRAAKAEQRAPGDFEALVEKHSRRMPRRSAEILARRELGRK